MHCIPVACSYILCVVEQVVSEIRNFIFSESAGSEHHDLITLNIQRGRDMGLPSYNNAREGYGMKPASSFEDINENKIISRTLELAYEGDVDAIDPFVGGMCEESVPGSQLGSLFHTAIKDQFARIRYTHQPYSVVQFHSSFSQHLHVE